ncbi:hypothetical protein GIW81_01520 [Hyphomicrobium sp. xq]|uniref:Uncharacterized protein n=1 Tax=Hyphomicrobium album TaxID=2665159 RepID=A0A6I3KH38_9HYPH|nr:hypothetical protein [Hyphomicrobium album]MTD93007.1 hypothetical protein [Hyphomicrobium album]
MKPVLALTAACGLACAALAAEVAVRLDDASVRFDRARWQASVSHDGISFSPHGEAARELDPVVLRVVAGEQSCAVLAATAFGIGHYDLSAIEGTPIVIGGIGGERFMAHTGCRNATPRGEIICAKVAGRTYLLQALNAGCEGRNLFSGIGPLEEIASGISFAAPR